MAERPQVVLLDVHVGSGDGIAFLAELRRLVPGVRVAMLTGTADTAAIRSAGPDAIVPKPFDPVRSSPRSRDWRPERRR